MSIPSRDTLDAIFNNELDCINYLISKNVFYTTYECPRCGSEMKLYIQRKKFQCNKKVCKGYQLSFKKGTFFFGSNLKCIQILRLAHLWISGVGRDSAIIISGHSPNTVTIFYKHFRQLVCEALNDEDMIIGGPGIIIEVDETKLGKRKYNRGHRVDGVWALVGIERTLEKKIFIIPIENRSSEIIDNILCKHVKEGSIIYTDCWKGYQNLQIKFNFQHETVNHSKEFFNHHNGVCTNTVEGLNNGIKTKIKARNRVKTGIEAHVLEYIWRRQNKNNLWEEFINALKNIHYDA